jgi:superfamily I DNA and/or RNA helicase
LSIADHRAGLSGRTLVTFVKRKQAHAMPWHKLRVGSPVVVSRYRNDDGNSEQGVVSKRTQDSLEVALNRWPEGDNFRIDLTADEVTRQRQLAAITMVKDSRGRLGQFRDILMGQREPTFLPALPEVDFQTTLNASQQQAVRFALSANDLAVIHGPPGTGKTTTVVELIVQAVQRGQQVLACAPSNTAVDNLLQRLVAKGQKVVRIGHPARVAESLRPYTLDGLAEQHENMSVIRDMYREAELLFKKAGKWTRHRPVRGEKEALRDEAKQLKKHAKLMEQQAIEQILARARIICATTTFNEDLLQDKWFDMLVIDEACQSTEPGCWVPILKADKIVLAGDHKQLPPTVLSREAADEGFALSLLERQVQIYGDKVQRMLNVQYRMHLDIMNFSSQHFYDNQLVADQSVQEHLLTDFEPVTESELTQLPIELIDSAGAGWDEEVETEGLSKFNPQEAHLVVAKVKQLIESGVGPADIAVIAPYAAQVRYLRDQLAQTAGAASVEVDTVDGFQGREKEAVIISTVRSNGKGEIGFLGDQRRMNVALTRAKRKLIVIGDSATLGSSSFFQSLLEYFQQHGKYRSVFEEPV